MKGCLADAQVPDMDHSRGAVRGHKLSGVRRPGGELRAIFKALTRVASSLPARQENKCSRRLFSA